jgi:hypothetical protein
VIPFLHPGGPFIILKSKRGMRGDLRERGWWQRETGKGPIPSRICASSPLVSPHGGGGRGIRKGMDDEKYPDGRGARRRTGGSRSVESFRFPDPGDCPCEQRSFRDGHHAFRDISYRSGRASKVDKGSRYLHVFCCHNRVHPRITRILPPHGDGYYAPGKVLAPGGRFT